MESYIKELLKKYKNKRILRRVVSVLCVIVLVMTIIRLRRETDALSRVPMCGMKKHTHTSKCYDENGNMVCGKTEHQHTDACYQVRPDEAAVEEFLEVDGGVVGILEADSSALDLGDINLDLTLDEFTLDDSSIVQDNAAAFEGNNEDAGKPEFTLGRQARLSEIIRATGLKIRLKSVVEVGVVDIDGMQIDLLSIEKDKKDYIITALKDFDSVDLALVMKNGVVTVTLVGGVAPVPEEKDETPADQPPDMPVPTREDGQNDFPLDISFNDANQEQSERFVQDGNEPSENKQTVVYSIPDVEPLQEQGSSDSNTEDGQNDAERGDAEEPGVDQADQGQDESVSDGNEAVTDEAVPTEDGQTKVASETDEEQDDDEQAGNGKSATEQSDAETSGESSYSKVEQGDDHSHTDDEQSGEEKADEQQAIEQTRDEQMVDQSGDDQVVEQSDEKPANEQADEQVGDGQTEDEQPEDQANDEQTAEEQPDEQTSDGQTIDEQIADEQTAEEQPDDQGSDEQSDDQVSDEQPDDQTGEEQIADEQSDDRVSDGQTDGQSGEEQTDDQAIDEQITDEQSDDRVSDEQADDQADDEQTDDQASDEQFDDQAGDEQFDDQAGDEQIADEQSDDRVSDGQTDGQSGEEQPNDQASDEQPTDEQPDGQASDGQTADEQSDDQASDEQPNDQASDGQTADEQSDDQVSDGQTDGQSGDEQADVPADDETIHPTYTATIDLSDVKDYPISLRLMMASAEAANPDAEAETGPDAKTEESENEEGTGEAEEGDAGDFFIDYDEALLSIEAADGDNLITPLQSFEGTTISVSVNASRYELTLVNCTLPEPESQLTYPARHFEENTETMKVVVDAPEGAFPQGTTMSVADVEDQRTISDIEDTVAEDFVEVKSVHAVDISFWYNGVEIEPLLPINVVMNVKEVKQPQDPVVVHVSDEGAAEVIDSEETGKAEVSMEMPAGEGNTPEDSSAGQGSAGEEGTPAPQESGESVAFSADSFSVYAVVFTETIETRFIDAAGETWNISVGYTRGANIPAEATLLVSEVMGKDAQTYLAQTAEALRGQETITHARFFDITILDKEGQEVQPTEPVEVRATLADGSDDAVKAIHFDDGGEMQILDAEHDDDAVAFNAESFSVYGIVYTVDFHWNANGESFEYSIVGGGAMSLRSLVEIMDVLGESPAEETDEANSGEQNESAESAASDYDTFMSEIESVTFSDETMVKPVLVTEDITAGVLIERLGLEPVYSAELTEEDIATLNAAAFRAPDWALVSLKAFDSEESLSIAMRNGDTITIRVTDAQLTKTVISASGQTWLITVTYGRDAGLPEGAELEVSEILPEEQQNEEASKYDRYVSKTQEALGFNTGEFDFIRLFDIKIVDENGEKVDITAPVDVKVELADMADADNESGKEEQNTQVVHFADGSQSGDVVDVAEIGQATNTEDGTMIRFEATGFSVYAIVSGPSGAEAGWSKLTSLENLTSKGYYIGQTSGYYLTNIATSKTSGEDTINGIKRTGKNAVPTVSDSELYYFENASDGKYYIYWMDTDNKKHYVVNKEDNSLCFKDEGEKTAFTVEVNNKAVFKIHNGSWYWNMQTGTGEGFYAKNSSRDGNNNLYLWEQTDSGTDTYGLDGKCYGLMTWTGGKTAKALMAFENTGADENNEPYSGCLEAKFLSVMTQKSKAGEKLYVPNNTLDTVTIWTFEWVGNDPNNRLNSYYYLKEENGKYLKISADGLSLVDEPCKIQVKPGTGNKEGQICLKSVGLEGKTLTYSGDYAMGYSVGGTAGSEWLYLVEEKPEDMLANYEKVYTATKISVSDTERINTGAKIIIYARQWKNDHYEYYALNSRGELVPCIESGDTIEWFGGNVNDMLWQFTEYVYEGTDTPNGYYELENLYARSNGDPSYLAPKYSDGSILSKDTVGVLLQGRTDKQYYSPIVAWDTPEYMYSALTVDLNQSDPVLEPCVRVDGLDFYFAVMEDLPVDDVLHEVPTVDNNDYGIVMKMADFDNGATNKMPAGSMNAFLHNTIDNGATFFQTSGLLSTNLGDDGYPVTTQEGSGGSLANLYSKASNANHLFIESTYRATGYFEYNSTQNFASLTESGNFRVYQELGTNDTTAKKTLQHGEFFPYNDIEAGRFASANPENLYKINADPLSDSDPRKHEQLYLVKGNTDYYFGMELEASFFQTPSGLDAWGHDIIFEFSGDDDFWLYVDGELVIDLGGIHSAMSGDVNFRTGVVHNNGETTSLYEVFKRNYMVRGDTEAQALAKVNALFTQNNAGQYVFNDNSRHTMRIFYMERGAGASNLHMKFNLATVKKGTVQLHKELKGVNDTETTYAVFPYQVFYTMEDKPGTEGMLRNAFDPNMVSAAYTEMEENVSCSDRSKDYVFYKDSTKPLTFLPELKVDGATYYNVFLLKPNETAVINFPTKKDDPTGATYTVDKYRIVECGIDPNVYTKVTVNGNEINGVPNADNAAISDYGIRLASTGDRPKVDYVNKVENLKNLTFTKELYRKFKANESPRKIVLYDSDGKPIEDPDLTASRDATFNFRLDFKTPHDKDFSAARLYIYHVKDPEGYYCAWNDDAGCFERITNDKYPGYLKSGYENGTKVFTNLTDDVVEPDGSVTHYGKFWASFETGTNGSISGIPAYYTVEVRDLIPGTKYRIIERPTETPEGYKFWQYEADGLVHTDTDPYDPWDGIEGTIKTNGDASAVVRNYKGYGFRLEKIWEDASTMKDRDPAYFALYKTDANGEPVELVDGSVRKLAYNADPQKLYWWYLTLPIANTGLEDYAVFEVILEGGSIAVGNNDVVSGYGKITPISDGGILTLNGTTKGQSSAKEVIYKVSYATPVYIGDNVRAFKATNSPAMLPPVQFLKTEWDGNALKGATFSLVDDSDNSVFEVKTKTSDENGLIGKVYLQANVDYTLTEISSPQGYVGIDPLTVRLEATSSGFELKVSPKIPAGYSGYYIVTVEDGVLTLTVKNHPYVFEAVKVDSKNTDQKLAGARFSLYNQVAIGTTISWDEDKPVYTDRCTDEDGLIPGIDENLPAGTYQLRETSTPVGYQASANIDFTVSPKGLIELGNHPEGVTLTKIAITENDAGKVRYMLTIPDDPVPLKLRKVDESGADLTGAKFTLKKYDNNSKVWEVVKYDNYSKVWEVVKSDDSGIYEIDMTSSALFDIEGLQEGLYQLEETTVPAGYVILEKHVYFAITTKYDSSTKMSRRVVTLTDQDGKALPRTEDHVKLEGADNGVYTIIVRNNPGVALPATGGMGTAMLYVIDGTVMLLALIGYIVIKRKARRD